MSKVNTDKAVVTPADQTTGSVVTVGFSLMERTRMAKGQCRRCGNSLPYDCGSKTLCKRCAEKLEKPISLLWKNRGGFWDRSNTFASVDKRKIYGS